MFRRGEDGYISLTEKGEDPWLGEKIPISLIRRGELRWIYPWLEDEKRRWKYSWFKMEKVDIFLIRIGEEGYYILDKNSWNEYIPRYIEGEKMDLFLIRWGEKMELSWLEGEKMDISLLYTFIIKFIIAVRMLCLNLLKWKSYKNHFKCLP